jgi:hypothetical protein
VKNHWSKFLEVESTTHYIPYHHWNKTCVFGAMYNRATWHRIGLASYLKTQHNDLTMLNFRSDPHNVDSRHLFEIQQLFECDIQSLVNFAQINHRFPVLLEAVDGYTVGATTQTHTDQLCNLYPNFFIDVVAETFVQGRTFFPTEKTIRPMLLKKPFIVMGPRNFLLHLRQMGFKTFSGVWDENYDGFETKDRYIHILTLINELSTKSINELNDMYLKMQEILDHNYNLLVTQQFTKKIDYVE